MILFEIGIIVSRKGSCMAIYRPEGYGDEKLPHVRLINFSHPLTEKNIREVQKFCTPCTLEVIDVEVQVDRSKPTMESAAELVATVPLTAQQWCEPLLINPPGLSPVAIGILYEVQRRCGYQPDFLAIRPVTNGLVRGFEVGEIVTAPSSWWIR